MRGEFDQSQSFTSNSIHISCEDEKWRYIPVKAYENMTSNGNNSAAKVAIETKKEWNKVQVNISKAFQQWKEQFDYELTVLLQDR